ncbi:ABC transporter permease [Timonella sp. A28]|uniref:ABC transporter permease n=1 Tax=Timonella sp. A28 TaxID=3442640 RepID=UPI003EBAC76A
MTAQRRRALRQAGAGITTFLGGAALVLWGAVTLAFLVLKLVPGDPVDVMLGPLSSATPQARELIRTDLGLDKPVVEQYVSYIGKVFTGDLGVSYQLGTPVIEVLREHATSTFALACTALAFACVLAGVGAVLSRRGIARKFFDFIELLAVSAPVFWTSLILAAVFSYQLGWFPIIGGSEFSRLILPACAMALPIAGVLAQVLRQGLDAAESEPFATTARARGLSRMRVTTRHTMRHASLGALTLGGFMFGSLLGGAVLTETVFARPGLGRVTLDAILGRDLPVVMGIVVFSALIFIVLNAVIDLLGLALDPRLRVRQARNR